MVRITNCCAERIAENGGGLGEGHLVFAEIFSTLLCVPFEFHSTSLPTATRQFQRDSALFCQANDEVKLRGRLVRRYVAESRNGGPVNFNALFGPPHMPRYICSGLFSPARICLIAPK